MKKYLSNIFTPFVLSVILISCNKTENVKTTQSEEGKYIGMRKDIFQGNNPIDGEYLYDSSYHDTIDVLLLKDSIVFIKGNYKSQYLKNDSNYYTGYRSYFKIKDFDTLIESNYFYSGVDAFHYASKTSEFIGLK
ncbi:MAG TPA: hypothetical protein PK546_06805 [Chitinophagales bacterium]|jgi:hypothetical protein|nr:hypothetical protein [Chitinophagales bacterium]HPN19235.1 hypothetical protein [Chitinophagales bacterium]